MMTSKEKVRRKHEKELNSFRNKMDKNLVWFDSLTLSKQYDLLFEWKMIKYQNRLKSPLKSQVRKFNVVLRKFETVEVISYPASIKYFIKSRRQSKRYRSNVDKAREAILNILFKNKNKI